MLKRALLREVNVLGDVKVLGEGHRGDLRVATSDPRAVLLSQPVQEAAQVIDFCRIRSISVRHSANASTAVRAAVVSFLPSVG
jgi:hypothetical protein